MEEARQMSRKAIRRTAVAAAAVVGLATGTTSTAEAIVNGQPIPIEQAPWTVYLTATNTYGTNACTGSIIEASRVLTAAHCVLRSGGQPAPNITVLAGTANSAGAGQRVVANSATWRSGRSTMRWTST